MEQMAQLSTGRTGRLGFQFESDAAASFLVLSCDAKVVEYQALMLEHNRVRHVLPVDVVMKEGMNCYYYNITSKISLSFFLGRRKLNREEFLKLLLDIAAVVNDSAGYLLTVSNFVFDPEYVYISPETLEPMLVYVPAALDGGCGTTLQTFISELLMLHINVEGFSRGNLVQKLLSEVKSELFNTKALILVLNDLLYADVTDMRNHPAGEEDFEERKTFLLQQHPQGKQPFKGGKSPAGGRPAPGNKPVTGGMPQQNVEPVQGGKPEPGMELKQGGKQRQGGEPLQIGKQGVATAEIRLPGLTILAVLLQIAMGAVIFAGRNFLNRISDNPTATYAAVIMIVLAIDLLLFKKLHAAKMIHVGVRQENPDLIKKEAAGMNTASEGFNEISRSTAREPARETIRAAAMKTVAASRVEAASARDKEPVSFTSFTDAPVAGIAVAGAPVTGASSTVASLARRPLAGTIEQGPAIPAPGKTELLSGRSRRGRMLKSITRQSGEEDIFIDKDDFIIGRLAEHVDHVIQNNAVGKLHAQILCRNGTCYIKDLNSVNGTFLNSKRIESNKEYELKENDRVLLANCEFVFLGG